MNVQRNHLRDIESEIGRTPLGELRAYLSGAMRDGTVSRLHGSIRIAQSSLGWRDVLLAAIRACGCKAWSYREGSRNIWVVESTIPLDLRPDCRTEGETRAFVRGYFDAEGGVPHSSAARFYIQLVQKDLADLTFLRRHVESLGIRTGRIHNPSVAVDPEYWRFYVGAGSQLRFIEDVYPWHPEKRERCARSAPYLARQLKLGTPRIARTHRHGARARPASR